MSYLSECDDRDEGSVVGGLDGWRDEDGHLRADAVLAGEEGRVGMDSLTSFRLPVRSEALPVVLVFFSGASDCFLVWGLS